jgi:hypothetical protein
MSERTESADEDAAVGSDAERSAFFRLLPLVVAVGVLFSASLIATRVSVAGAAVALVFSGVFGGTTYLLWRWRATLAAAIVALNALAYMPGLAQHASEGVHPEAFSRGADEYDVVIALTGVALQSLVLLAFSFMARKSGTAVRTPFQNDLRNRALTVATFLGVAVMILGIIDGLRLGSLFTRGIVLTDRLGESTFVLLVDEALVLVFMLGRMWVDRNPSTARSNLIGRTLQVAAFLLSLVRQVRRLSVALVLFEVLQERRLRLRTVLRSSVLGVIGVGTVLLVAQAWRSSALAFETDDITERVSDTLTRLGSNDNDEKINVGERLTYTAFDSIVVHAVIHGEVEMSAAEQLVGRIRWAMPSKLSTSKKAGWDGSCEEPVWTILDEVDLPCTQNSELWLARNLLWSLGVSIVSAGIIAFGDYLLRAGVVPAYPIAAIVFSSTYAIEVGSLWSVSFLRELAIWFPIIVLTGAYQALTRRTAQRERTLGGGEPAG